MSMALNPGTWLLACSPIALLVFGILVLKWEPAKVGAFTWFVAAIIAVAFFGAGSKLLLLANCKGFSLSLFVLLIIWSAVFLYNIADKAGAVQVIGATVQRISDSKDIQCLFFAWCFTGVLQGLAGFGIPVAIVAPIMIAMGFSPLIAVTTCLVGHSWAISFGSMGSSYITIQLVTSIPGEVIGPWMAIVFSVAIFATGFCVAHLYGGWSAVKKNAAFVLVTGAVMSAALWAMNIFGMPQLATLIAGTCGCMVIIGYVLLKRRREPAAQAAPATGARPAMSFNTACAPYYALIGISILSQIKPVKAALSGYYWGLSYPAVQTKLGYTVEAVSNYSKIMFFSHPAPILIVSAIIGIIIYSLRAGAPKNIVGGAAKATLAKCIPMSVGIMTMVMMALVMSDSGMTYLIAQGIAKAFGPLYPLAAPFIGGLGSFITGSNTNSNIMFGLLQVKTALLIGKSSVLIAAAQSVGGSLGISMTPSTIMMGCANVGLSGEENKVLGKTMKYCLFNITLVGIFVLVLDHLFTV